MTGRSWVLPTAGAGLALVLVLGWSALPEGGPDPQALARMQALQAEWAGDARPGATLRAADEAAARDLGRKAMRQAQGVLAEEPGRDEAWLRLVAWSARWPQYGGLSVEDQDRVLAVVAERSPDAPALAGARAWRLLAGGDPEGARLAAEQAPPGEVLALGARLRAAMELGLDPTDAALALHSAAPDDLEGCRLAARGSLSRGNLLAAEEVLADCAEWGSADPVLSRVSGQLLDMAGEPADACRAYLDAGARLHAAAIEIQDGACPPGSLDAAALDDILEQDLPEARLHAVWAALLQGRAEDAVARSAAIAAAPYAQEPPFRLARGAALIAAGDAEAALGAVDGLESVEASLVRGRALALLGRADEAEQAFAGACARGPWLLAAWRERLAHAATRGPAAVATVADQLLVVDPVALALAPLEPDRLQPLAAFAPSPWPPDAALDPETRLLRWALDPPGPQLPPDLRALAAGARDRLLRHLLASAALGGLDPAGLPGEVLDPARADSADLAALQRVVASRRGEGRGRPPEPLAEGPRVLPTLRWARAEEALQAGRAELALAEAEALVVEQPDLPGVRGWRYSVALEAAARGTVPPAGRPAGRAAGAGAEAPGEGAERAQ